MSRANGGRGARRLDLKLNLSLPARGDSSASRRMLAAPADDESSPSSCVSSESEQHGGGSLQWSDSPEATSMVLAACPRCFIYVMLAEADPRCPKCRSPVILDFLHGSDSNRNDDDGINNHSRGTKRRGRRNRRERMMDAKKSSV